MYAYVNSLQPVKIVKSLISIIIVYQYIYTVYFIPVRVVGQSHLQVCSNCLQKSESSTTTSISIASADTLLAIPDNGILHVSTIWICRKFKS